MAVSYSLIFYQMRSSRLLLEVGHDDDLPDVDDQPDDDDHPNVDDPPDDVDHPDVDHHHNDAFAASDNEC